MGGSRGLFFCQREDGNRDVAEVQTWALPIDVRPSTPTGGSQAEYDIRDTRVVQR